MDRAALREALAEPEVVAGCLVVLYASQTPGEQSSKSTTAQNGEGFNALDASFGSSLAEQVIGEGRLTTKQVGAARNLLRKYVGQIAGRVDEAPRQPLDVRTVITNKPVESDLDEIPL